ncbi:MAG: hypothetical protein U9N39_00865 [Campylobacterota bacterium]|nr:hypothetical protein [Campylobacterota bacterium]
MFISFIIKALLIVFLFPNVLSAMSGGGGSTLVVDGDPKCTDGLLGTTCESCEGGDYYDTIQAAVDYADSGDVISVCDETYDESVTITTDNLLIGKSDDAEGDVIVKNSDSIFKINGVDTLTLYLLHLDHTSDKAAISIDSYSEKITFSNLSVKSQDGDGIETNGENAEILVTGTSIVAGNDGIDFNGQINDGVFITDTNISATDKGITANANINGGVDINNTIILADNKGINFDNDVDGGTSLKNTQITSSDYGVYFNKKVNDGIEVSSVIIHSYDAAMEFNEEINGGIALSQSTIQSDNDDGIDFNKNVNSGVSITNINLISAGNGLEFDGNINDGLTISDSNVSAQGKGFEFMGELNDNIEIENISIISALDGINFGNVINDGVNILSSDINSTDARGIDFQDNVYGDCKIDDVTLTAKGRALYFNDKQITPTITDSNITSLNDDAIYTKNKDSTKFTLEDSCVSTNKNGEFALWINNSSTNAEVSGNCFYATAVNRLAKAKKNGNSVSGNYWDNNIGDYTLNKISDTSTLGSCPLNCVDDNTSFTPENKNYKLDAWDTFRDISDRNISTKIATESFSLNINALDENGTNYQEFNGTVCSCIDTQNCFKNLFLEHNSSIQTSQGDPNFTIDKATQSVRVDIHWQKNVDTTCPLTTEDNSTLSSDEFAIRPKSFSFSLPSEAYAGENFIIDFNASSIVDYNETINNSFLIESNITKVGCNIGTLNIADFSFLDGKKESVDANYTNIGDLNITLKEKLGSEYALVDADDSNDTVRLIETFSDIISIQPYELNITLAEMNASTNTDWLYMANVTDMNLSLFATLQANNKQHQVLEDFNDSCYAEDVDIDFSVSLLDGNGSLDMNYTLVSGSSLSAGSTLGDINKTLTIDRSSFVSGEANASYVLNVDRNFSTPVNPFEVKDMNVTIATSDVAKHENNNSDTSSFIFYYAKITADDIITQKEDVEHFAEVEVYDANGSSYVSGFTQNSLRWYRNSNHDSSFTDISEIDGTESSSLDTVDINITSFSVANGKIDFNITNSDKKSFYMHIKTQDWLWYIPSTYGSEYDDTTGSKCLTHPCFKYSLKSSATSTGVKSGEFKGTDYTIPSRGDYEKTGVKVFR